jgi:hypothetical protein
MENTPYIIRENTEEGVLTAKNSAHHDNADADTKVHNRVGELNESFQYGAGGRYGTNYRPRYNRKGKQGVV